MDLPYTLDPPDAPRLGLILLQADERLESDLRRLLPVRATLLVSRVASGDDLTEETLTAQIAALPHAAWLLPKAQGYDVLAYGCTSGAAVIGSARIGDLLRGVLPARTVTDPVCALIAACRTLGLSRLALLSPYVADVSARLREVLLAQGIATPVFGSFNECQEARVARIAADSIVSGVQDLAARGGIDGVFLSCTNLRTLDLIAPLEARTGLPILSSNQVLGWHMMRAAGLTERPTGFGRLLSGA